ncbi:hypothetical protein [Morganella psychrotolerans]|uniref:hypothetical protein n=1 Tax=Morganella psychrotolerans TaxID=368603 RepID=UPI0039AFC0E9
MKELSVNEIETISGAGFIKDGFISLGGEIGDFAFKQFGKHMNVNVPIFGSINIASKFPGLGKDVGSQIGGSIGNKIETNLSGLPIIGGLFKGIFA